MSETMTTRGCPCQRSTRTGPWIVSTAHRSQVLVGFDLVWVPHGLRHARQIGSTTTACGQPAHLWRNFHEMAFVPGAAQTCRACAERVLASRSEHRDRRPSGVLS